MRKWWTTPALVGASKEDGRVVLSFAPDVPAGTSFVADVILKANPSESMAVVMTNGFDLAWPAAPLDDVPSNAAQWRVS